MPGAMTPEEIRYHARRIAAMRSAGRRNNPDECGANDFNPNRRRHMVATRRNAGGVNSAPVDLMFAARVRAGWLPRGGDE